MVNYDIQINGKTVHYDKTGMPDLTPHSPRVDGSNVIYQPTNKNLTGKSADFSDANNWAIEKYGNVNIRRNPTNPQNKIDIKIDDNWVECTWHHHQDGKTMFPVPTSLHKEIRHSGGAAIIEGKLQGFFESPIF